MFNMMKNRPDLKSENMWLEGRTVEMHPTRHSRLFLGKNQNIITLAIISELLKHMQQVNPSLNKVLVLKNLKYDQVNHFPLDLLIYDHDHYYIV